MAIRCGRRDERAVRRWNGQIQRVITLNVLQISLSYEFGTIAQRVQNGLQADQMILQAFLDGQQRAMCHDTSVQTVA